MSKARRYRKRPLTFSGKRPYVWWSIVHGTRTQHFLTGDRFGIIREVEIEYDPVIKDVDRVDKGINDLPLVFRAAHVTLAEFFQARTESTHGSGRAFQLFFQNAGVQGFFPGFQLVQPLLGGRGQDALFNGFQKVCESFLCIPELLFQNRQPGVLPCCWASMTKSISRSMISSLKITLMAVSTTNRSSGSLRMAFRSQCAFAVAFGVAALVVIVGVSPMWLVPLSPPIRVPHLPQNSLVVSRYLTSSFAGRPWAILFCSKRCCTRSNRSWSTMAGMPPGVTMSF